MGLEAHNSTEDHKQHLFLGLDKSKEGDQVIFIYRKEYADQATLTISALPLILQAHYGTRCGNWLTGSADQETDGWTYNKVTGEIKSKEDDYTSDILKGWDNDNVEEDEESNNLHVILGGANTHNQFDDNRTVMTMGSDLSGWSSSSNEITTAERMLKKMQK